MTFIIKVFIFCLNVIYLFFKLFKKRNQITLISRQSNKLTQDFKLLKEELEKQLPDYKIIVLTKTMDNKIEYVFHLLVQMYHLSRSKVVILDSYCILASILKHKKDLKIIQIWHALGLIKKAGYSILDMEEGRSSKISHAMRMHKNYNYVFTTSEACRQNMSEVFGCDIDIVKNVPLPRIDFLKDTKTIQKKKEKILKENKKLNNKKINILYAPTYRKDEELMLQKTIELINSIDYKKYNLILKLHPLTNFEINDDRVIIDKKYSTTEMMYVSDYVISDYSSIIYEAGILKKKLIFYSFDLETYRGTRDFFIDYENEVPGPICKDSNEVKEFLSKPDYKKYKDRDMISKYVDLTIKNYTKNMVNEIKKIIKEK